MNQESANMSSKTWFRSMEPINKAGYMDGAADGQAASFQASFNLGYEQGLKFGLKRGFNEALQSMINEEINNRVFADPRKINCQLCLNGDMLQEKLDKLHHTQEAKNSEYLQTSSF